MACWCKQPYLHFVCVSSFSLPFIRLLYTFRYITISLTSTFHPLLILFAWLPSTNDQSSSQKNIILFRLSIIIIMAMSKSGLLFLFMFLSPFWMNNEETIQWTLDTDDYFDTLLLSLIPGNRTSRVISHYRVWNAKTMHSINGLRKLILNSIELNGFPSK